MWYERLLSIGLIVMSVVCLVAVVGWLKPCIMLVRKNKKKPIQDSIIPYKPTTNSGFPPDVISKTNSTSSSESVSTCSGQPETSNTNSNTSLHQQDNSSGDTPISSLPRGITEYTFVEAQYTL